MGSWPRLIRRLMCVVGMARKRSQLGKRNTAPQDVTADWSKGMVRDAPRTAIPPSALYNSVDWLLHKPGIMQKRGGTEYAGPAMSGQDYAGSVIYAPFPAGAKLLVVNGGEGSIYECTSGAMTDLGGSNAPDDSRAVFRPGATSYVVFPDPAGSVAPVAYDGSAAPANLGGSPPAGRFGCVYKTRLVLGGTAANPQRIYFSPTPDIASAWDTTNSWIDADYEITGFAATNNMLLIFSQGHTERIIGSTPPPGSDMDKSVIGSIGCTDARSIVVQENNVLFANPRGVWLTNGSGFASLTTEGLVESYWQDLFSGYDPATWSIAAGIYRSFYFVSIMDGTTLIDTLMCNVPRRAWWRLSNINACYMTQSVGADDELYYADRVDPRVVKISGIFSPSSSNKNDANGTAVEPVADLRLNGTGPGLKHFGFGRLTFDMRDSASDNPQLAVSVAAGIEATTFAAAPESPLSETTDADRQRVTIGKVSQGVNIRLDQTNASSKTEVYALEVEERALTSVAGGE